MNDAILKFRRYEDASLAYMGVNRHAADTRIGLMDSIVSIEALHVLIPRRTMPIPSSHGTATPAQ